MLTETEANLVVKAFGWTPRTRNARGTVKHYLYAYRRRSGKLEERYVCKVEALAGMSVMDILHKLS